MEREVLKKATAFFEGKQMRFRFIDAEKADADARRPYE
jgi:hypothetical protein